MEEPPAPSGGLAPLGPLLEDMSLTGNVVDRTLNPDSPHPFHAAAAEHVPSPVPSMASVVAAAAEASERAALGGMIEMPDDRRLNAIPDPDLAFNVGDVAATQLADVAAPLLSGSDNTAVWKAGLGRRLVEEVGEHTDAAPLYQSPAQAERASVAYELASFAESARAGRLKDERLAKMVGRLDELDVEEAAELADAVTVHAKLTEPFVHPEQAIAPGVEVRKVDTEERTITLGVRPYGYSKDIGERVDTLGFAPQWLAEQGAYGLMDAFDDFPDKESDDRSALTEVIAGTKADWLGDLPDVTDKALRLAKAQLSEEQGREVSEKEILGAALAASKARNVHHRRVLDTLSGSEDPRGKMPVPSVAAGWDQLRLEPTPGSAQGNGDVEMTLDEMGAVVATGKGRPPRGLRQSGLMNGDRELLAPWAPLPLSADAKEYLNAQTLNDLPDHMLTGQLPERLVNGDLGIQLAMPLKDEQGGRIAGDNMLNAAVRDLKQRGFQFEVEEGQPSESRVGRLDDDGNVMPSLVPKANVTIFPTLASDFARILDALDDEVEVIAWPQPGMSAPDWLEQVEADVFTDDSRAIVQLNRNQTRTSVPVWVRQSEPFSEESRPTQWKELPDGTVAIGGRALMRPQPSEVAPEQDVTAGIDGFKWEGDKVNQIQIDGVSPAPQVTVGHSTHAPIAERDGALLLNREGDRWVPSDKEQVWLLDAGNLVMDLLGLEVSL